MTRSRAALSGSGITMISCLAALVLGAAGLGTAPSAVAACKHKSCITTGLPPKPGTYKLSPPGSSVVLGKAASGYSLTGLKLKLGAGPKECSSISGALAEVIGSHPVRRQTKDYFVGTDEVEEIAFWALRRNGGFTKGLPGNAQVRIRGTTYPANLAASFFNSVPSFNFHAIRGKYAVEGNLNVKLSPETFCSTDFHGRLGS
jgi:hypothetical protein